MRTPAGFRTALCVAAHPDDEILGAGATLASLGDRGCDTHVLVLGEGVGARFAGDDRPAHEVAELAGELRRAAAIVGATPHQLDLPDNRFDALDMLDVVQRVEAVCAELAPDLVFTHHPGDLNVDHRVTANAVLTALRPLPGQRPVTLLGFETLSSTEWNVPANGAPFAPSWFWDATPRPRAQGRGDGRLPARAAGLAAPALAGGDPRRRAALGDDGGAGDGEAFALLRRVERRLGALGRDAVARDLAQHVGPLVRHHAHVAVLADVGAGLRADALAQLGVVDELAAAISRNSAGSPAWKPVTPCSMSG